jgi:hypothetical protein
MTVSIVGLDEAESDLILGYLYDVYEKNVDIQVRFKWTLEQVHFGITGRIHCIPESST